MWSWKSTENVQVTIALPDRRCQAVFAVKSAKNQRSVAGSHRGHGGTVLLWRELPQPGVHLLQAGYAPQGEGREKRRPLDRVETVQTCLLMEKN